MRKGFLLFILGFFSIYHLHAYDFAVENSDGVIIYYNNKSDTEATVTSGSGYSGNIVIPDKVTYSGIIYLVTSIGSNAFQGCSGLTSIFIPNSIISIEDNAFKDCNNLTNIIIEDGTETLPFSYISPFSDCPINELYLGRNITYPHTSYTYPKPNYYYSPFRDKITLVSLSIGSLVTTIGSGAFGGCNGLTDVTIKDGESDLSFKAIGSYGSSAFEGCPIQNIYLGRNMSTSLFSYTTTLVSLSISDSVKSIGNYAFRGCSGLSNLIISNSVTSIGNMAFESCSKLTELVIPNSVTLIDKSAFAGCDNLIEVILEDGTQTLSFGATSFGTTGYLNSPIKKLYLGRNLSFSFDTGSPFGGKTTLEELIIGNSVTDIHRGTFYSCSGLKDTLTIPNSVGHIGDYAFYECSGLTSLSIPDYAYPYSISYIGKYAFGRCTGLIGTLTIPNSPHLYFIADGAFSGCTGLTELIITDFVTSIGNYSFGGCSGLTSLSIPNSIKSIGDEAFSSCTGLTGTLTIPNSVTSIGNYAFSDCTGLKNLILEDGTTTLDIALDIASDIGSNNTFKNCSIDSLYLGRNIGGKAPPFRLMSLISLTIGNSVTSIGNSAFESCRKITKLVIPNSISSIGSNAFKNSTSLIEISCQNPIPPQADRTTFANVNKTECILYVPISFLSLYKAHYVWEEFFNIQEKDFSATDISTVDFDNDISVFITDGGLKIEGCDFNDKVSIYTITGQMIYNSIVGDGIIAYPFQKGSVYIIKTPEKALKIIY
jgi:hypothetical protein